MIFHYLSELQSVNNKVFLIEDNVRNGCDSYFWRRKNSIIKIISANGSSSVVKNLIDEACRFSRKLGALLCLVTIHNSQSNELSKDAIQAQEGINTFKRSSRYIRKHDNVIWRLRFRRAARNLNELIISYDCEGIWGRMDKIDSLDKKIFNRNALMRLYQELLVIHEKYNLKATFAFAGGFISSKEEFLEALINIQVQKQ